jgi:AcrR family transcriptional regulator
MSSESRRYELKARALSQEETRRRLAAATAELHQEVGPARTTISEIARRARVQRPTVYSNFPEEADLHRACQVHFLTEHPPPDLSEALALADPPARTARVLELFYGWYRETAAMSANVERDRGAVPALDVVMRESVDQVRAGLATELAKAFGGRGRRAARTRAMVALALDFWTWKRLQEEGLGDADAAAAMVAAIGAAADPKAL